MFAKSNLHNNLDLLPDLSNKKLYFVCTSKLDPVEKSPIWRAFSLCSRCNNPHVYHVNVAFTLKIYQISGLTNTFCAHKYFSYLFTKFDGEQICFSDVVLSLEIISEGWRSLAVGAHFDIIAIVFLYHHYCFWYHHYCFWYYHYCFLYHHYWSWYHHYRFAKHTTSL